MNFEDNTSSSTEVLSDDSSSSENEDWKMELSEEQRKLFEEKLAAAQKQFKVFNSNQKNQKISDVLCHIKDIDEASADIAIQSCYGNELLAIKRLMEEKGFKETVVDMASGAIELDIPSISYRDKRQEMREALQFDPEVESEPDEGDYFEVRAHKRSKEESSKPDEDEFVQPKERDRKCPRLLLDDALIMLANQVTQEPATPKTESKDDSDISIPEFKTGRKSVLAEEKALFAALSGAQAKKIPDKSLIKLGWSEARIKAFKNREKNPNQYYYRFNDPGEPQATGKWSDKDKALFLKIIKEKGVDYQWGIFSMQIPGRVGYQCSNFYRQLIKEGEIQDENYVKNKDGKYVFMFRNKNGESTLKRSKTSSSKTRKSTRRVITYDPVEEVPDDNVLPDYIDPMTMMPVTKPAISPYGHVMGYESWVKVLNKNPKNTCPFTKKKLTRRSLIKLTTENIDEYRDKIINVTGIESDLHSS